MSDLDTARSNPEELLWDNLENVHAGLLGLEDSRAPMQPMAHHVDRAGRRLWFLTRRETDFYQELRSGSAAQFCVISKGQDFHASILGTISERQDPAMLEEIWNPVVSAWFTGKDDPELKMLAFELKSAAIWASTGGGLAFAWETAKANLTGGTPDLGVHNEIVFA